MPLITPAEKDAEEERDEWTRTVPGEILSTLPDSEVNRQKCVIRLHICVNRNLHSYSIIHKLVHKEKQYLRDLDTIETLFIRPLRNANPPIVRLTEIDEFIDEVFGNILDLRECNRRLLEMVYVRQREQAPVIQTIGDIFLEAATEFRLAYPIYVGHLPVAEKRMKDEMEKNAEFKRFIEVSNSQLGMIFGLSPDFR